jgi:phosphoglycerate kinase
MDYSNKKTLNDINVDRQKVIVRVDFNVPIKDGVVVDNKRIMAPLETIRYLIDRKCKIILLSHLSRIKTLEDMSSNKKSLSPVADELQRLLTRPSIVKFLRVNRGQEVKDAVNQLGEGNILLLENTRYNDVNEKGEVVKLESKCDQTLSKE